MNLRENAALRTLSVTDAIEYAASGAVTSEHLVDACLNRIRTRETKLRAWAYLDAKGALGQARALDVGPVAGRLHGIPIGVKDVIDVEGMPTGMGSSIHANHIAFSDAACVAEARAEGAVVLGKTETAEYAGITPARTRNPIDISRTPGGSSSGSAVAVADGMVFAAIGTQTGGSILRPAAYCGVIGFKPSFGSISRQGLFLAAESFDTIGVLTRNVTDAALFWQVLAGMPPLALTRLRTAPKFALMRGPKLSQVQPEMNTLMSRIVTGCRDWGANVEELSIPQGFEEITIARGVVNDSERARAMAWEWMRYSDLISPQLRDVLRRGRRFSESDRIQAHRQLEHWRSWLSDTLENYDAILTPAVEGEAPRGLGSTGSPRLQEVWTALHAPTIAVPVGHSSAGLPLAVQLVGRKDNDVNLLNVALWLEKLGSVFGR